MNPSQQTPMPTPTTPTTPMQIQSTSPTNNKPAADKKDAMDIDVIIDKIDKMPIPDADKASLLNQIKQNMMNPSRGEDENLNRIQSKYMSPTLFPTYPIPGEQSFMPPNPQPHSQPHSQPRQHKIIEQQTRAGVLFQSIGFSEVMILKCAFNN